MGLTEMMELGSYILLRFLLSARFQLSNRIYRYIFTVHCYTFVVLYMHLMKRQ